MANSVIEADCIATMFAMEAADTRFDAIVTDPPYGMGAWDWIGHRADLHDFYTAWAGAARCLVAPGSHMLVFGGTKHSHRAFSAIEDADWELRDTLCWLYGGGMPKNHYNLKPAWEPIALFRRPLSDKAQKLNIEECRIPTQDNLNGGAYAQTAQPRTGMLAEYAWGKASAMRNGAAGEYVQPTGRFPANVMLDEEAAKLLDDATAHLKTDGRLKGGEKGRRTGHNYGDEECRTPWKPYGDSGGASRFFYCAKAAPSERHAGVEEQNRHPTVKPLALMRWLVRLITPPDGTILDPFCGSGSTGCAAVLEDRQFYGIDNDPTAVGVARQRLAHWTQQAKVAT